MYSRNIEEFDYANDDVLVNNICLVLIVQHPVDSCYRITILVCTACIAINIVL